VGVGNIVRKSECQFGTAVLTVSYTYIWGWDKQQGRQDNLKLHENEYKQNNII
jgi:hypothetical protein